MSKFLGCACLFVAAAFALFPAYVYLMGMEVPDEVALFKPMIIYSVVFLYIGINRLIVSDKDLASLGGWLVFIGVGLILTPIHKVDAIYSNSVYLFEQDMWAMMVTPGSDYYHPLLPFILSSELVMDSLLLLLGLWLLPLFFSKHHLFPRIFIASVIIQNIYLLTYMWSLTLVYPEQPMFDPERVLEYAAWLIMDGIWICYMLLSKRVKAAFGENQADQREPKRDQEVCTEPA